MRTRSCTIIAFIGFSLLAAAPAAAQTSTATWVASTGSDSNACTRAAPCLTFAGALAHTAAGGQINCVDAADYGLVTITQSLTIDCEQGRIIAPSGNAITISAGSSDTVTLRGIKLDGALTGASTGIYFTGASKVFLDGMTIRNFLADGIWLRPGSDMELFVTDSTISNNRSSTAGAGLYVQPAGSPTVSVTLTRVNINGNSSAGIRVKNTAMTGGGVAIKVRDSSFLGNAYGVVAQANSGNGAAAAITIQDSEFARNTYHGLAASGTLAEIVVSNSAIVGNGMGVLASDGAIYSTGDNLLTGNTANGSFSATVAKQ